VNKELPTINKASQNNDRSFNRNKALIWIGKEIRNEKLLKNDIVDGAYAKLIDEEKTADEDSLRHEYLKMRMDIIKDEHKIMCEREKEYLKTTKNNTLFFILGALFLIASLYCMWNFWYTDFSKWIEDIIWFTFLSKALAFIIFLFISCIPFGIMAFSGLFNEDENEHEEMGERIDFDFEHGYGMYDAPSELRLMIENKAKNWWDENGDDVIDNVLKVGGQILMSIVTRGLK